MRKKIAAMILFVVMLLSMFKAFTTTVTAATEAEINLAINLGMSWLATQQNVDGSWGIEAQVAKTGFAVLKFETHAVSMGEDPLDPTYEYYDQVMSGLDYIFANASIISISPQPGGDPDMDGDGIGVYFGALGLRTYETSIAMMAIAASTYPEMVVDVPGSSVDGWTYEEVLQDAVDYLAFGQTDVGSGRGGWSYEEIDNGEGWSDNSNTGYAVLGLAYAEATPPYGFALTIPAFVKSELGEANIWIDYIQNDPGPLDDGVEIDPDGGSGYIAPDEWVNILKTGSLLFEMAFVGDTAITPRVVDSVDYIERHWNDADEDPGWRGFPGGNASYQAMYTTMKGFETLGIDTIIVDSTEVDWFDEMSTVLVAQQNLDGSWPSCFWDDGEQILATEWALLTLQKAVPPPVTRGLVEEWRFPMFYYEWGWFGSSPAVADLGPDVNNNGTEPDSDLEIITGSDEGAGIFWELGGAEAFGIWRSIDSGGNLEWAKDTETDEARSSPAVIDIDGDGDLEIAAGTTSGCYVEVMNHTGGFVWTFPTLVGFWVSGDFVWPSSPAVADVDASVSGLELVIGNRWLGNVWCFDGDNSDGIDDGITIAYSDFPWVDDVGTPLPLGSEGTDWDVLWIFNTGHPVISSPAVGDVDNDGTPEVVIGSTDGNVYILDGLSGSIEHAFITGGAVIASAALGNLDGDAYLEIVIGSNDTNIYCFQWNGGIASTEWTYPTGAEVCSSAAIGDVDGDGSLEIVVGSIDGDVFSISTLGIMEWVYATGGAVFSSPALADADDVSKYESNWPMFRNNPSRTGLYGMAPPTHLDVYVGSDDGYLYLLDGDSGSLVDRFEAYAGPFGGIRTSPSVADIDGDYKLEIVFYDWGTSSTRGGHTLWCIEDGVGIARALYAGGSDPGVVYQYAGGTQWNIVSPTLGNAVLSLCEYEGHLYAGTVSGEIGRVWRYDGGTTWTLVGDNMDNWVCSLIVFRGNLYAGTAFVAGRLYRYDGGTMWTMVVNYTRQDGDPPSSWSGFWSLYVWNDILYIGDASMDLFGHYDGTTFTYDADLGGSCIWNYEVYDNNLYASAYVGRVHKSSDGTTWTTIRDYQDYDSWELETFQGYLYVTTGPKLERYDGTIFSLVWTEPRGNETISMISNGNTLILGTGTVGYGGSGVGRVYTYDGTQVRLISGDLGSGIQALLGGLPPPEMYDVAAVDVTPSKTVVGKGYSLFINATVENQGDLAETFNATIYYGNATITPEQWETFWSMGDVNRDGYINETDLSIMNAAFGSTPGAPNWNPWADLDQDLNVDIFDRMILQFNYGLDIWTHFISGAVIETQTIVNLPSGASTTRTFVWNTIGVPYGNYTISAYAVPILCEEVDRADNNYGDDIIVVTIPGDVDGDRDVDISDKVTVHYAWGSLAEDDPNTPWDDTLHWNPYADINADGANNIIDIVILNKNYGLTW